ncbi:MAG: MFS transporter [Actinobacteria bacterium]|nr:MAG: MFS transporter [Actinomycetota bacterium]
MNAARRLALGRLISLMGGSAAYIALIATLYGRTGSAAWVSAALFAGVVGSVIGAPGAGYVGDRFERRRVMIATDLVSAAVAGAMALVVDEPAALVALFGLHAVVTSPFAPASAAAMPNLVGEEKVARANALVAATTSAGYLLGPLAGGLLLGVGVSTPTLFAVDGATFVVSAVFVASIRRSFGQGGGTESHPGVLAGVRVIRREPMLRLLVAASMTSLLGIGIVNVAAYPLSLRLGGGTEGYGAMEALLGGGGLVGAALAARLLTTARAPAIVAVSFGASSIGLALASGAPVLLVALAGMALAGTGRGLGEVADTTLVQARTDDAVRSRVFAAEEGAAHVAFSVAMLAGGVLVGAGGARFAVGAAAASALLAALIASRMRATSA